LFIYYIWTGKALVNSKIEVVVKFETRICRAVWVRSLA